MLWQNSINSVIFSAINVLESEGLNLKTGFKELDEIITLDSNKLILVYGKPAVGKTTFALNIINNVASQNIPSLFFSLELSKESITNENAETLFIDDSANVSIDYIEGKCRNLKQEQNIEFVVIDYLQLINFKGNMNELGSKLKALAEELNVTILLLSQLKCENDKRLTLEDLKQSKPVAEIADVVMFLCRNNNIMNIIKCSRSKL